MTQSQQARTEDLMVRPSAGRRVKDLGMTLMEIMIVFALIALIMGAVGVGAFQYFKKGQMKTARIQVNEIMHDPAFQKLEGIAFQYFSIFKGSRFGLVGVTNHVMRPEIIG